MYKMEVDKILSHSAYALPVGGVLILAVLVFAFGFKTVSEPSFDKVPNDGSKKKKPAKQQQKAKKTMIGNGSASPVPQTSVKKAAASPAQPKSPAKAAAKKESPPKKAPEVKPKVEKKTEKAPKIKEPKPADYDDGDWQAVNKKEKKNKRVEGASNNVSPVASPTQRQAKKGDEKHKDAKKKEEEPKKTEIQVKTEAVPEKPAAAPKEVKEEKPVVAEKAPKNEKPTDTKPVEVAKPDVKKEKNNNNAPKPQKIDTKPLAEVKAPEDVIPVADESEDPWQENKASKKKKKARRE